MMVTMTVEAIEKDLRKQIAVIGEAVSRVKAGVIMNINEVEEQVAQICARIGSLSQEDGQKLEQSMAEMIGKLEDLAAALSEFQNKGSDGTH